ncbi:MAG: FIG00800187: hypothetical protein, partial [uncultured Rubrobacteraceae bacterium]
GGTPDPDAQDGRPLARGLRPPARGALPERAQLYTRPPDPLPQAARRPGAGDLVGPGEPLPPAGPLLPDGYRPRLHGTRRGLQAGVPDAARREKTSRRRVVAVARRPGPPGVPAARYGPEQGHAGGGARPAPAPGGGVRALRGRGGGAEAVAVPRGAVGAGGVLRFRRV